MNYRSQSKVANKVNIIAKILSYSQIVLAFLVGKEMLNLNEKKMKTFKLTLTLLLLSAAWSYAQIPMTMVEKIKDEQVPAAVLKTFESDFGTVKSDIKGGAWYAHFEHTSDATTANPDRSKAIPLHYSYKGKKGDNKVEIEFTPEGKLIRAKGMEKNLSGSN